ncbi:YopX family protein [Streptococcus acidominimus]|uniref:YopX protein domain-containing protein n=1 Tax=Streptococcus acidominimus TaxID=1326 RepID=A0A4Y9FNV2_STRAI|nr:YopX family protein [Streptococcus acidominimus]MBF0818732.1 hypothetical protein [Streptococcus acidominimus]MBF0838324.1 hypothetical protein [Streptococcus acidominimus]MBF0848957.1 hypothetical protein [Streptococcus danieliae]TFU30894.1 hypothetical protein E4U01_04570 [Streptococcus acidominimus]
MVAQKFRAWIKSKQRMESVASMTWHKDELSRITTRLNGVLSAHLPDDIAHMRSTGLFDKTDVEIFEGDILEWHYSEVPLQQCGVYAITWKNGAFRLGLNDGETLFDFIDDLDWFEVVGNIYENPDLLEVGACSN